MYYSSIGVLSLIVHIIINIEALKKPEDPALQPARSKYRMFLYGVMLYYVSDILWGTLYENRLVMLTYIDTVIYFASMVLSVLFWTRFVVAYLNSKGRFGRILVISGWVILLYEVVVLILNLFIPVAFGFAEDKEYEPGRARYITLFIQMFLFLMTSVYAITVSLKTKDRERSHHRAIGFSGLIMTVFIALQSLYPLMPFYSIGCLLATCLVHSFVYKDVTIEYSREIEREKKMAYRDPLTGVKNKLAYLDKLRDIEMRMQSGELEGLGVVVFDVNGLKTVNDTLGHDAGDEYIKSACRIICHKFKHSPVFRVGGDEFVAILEGDDYDARESLVEEFDKHIEDNRREGLVVIASGLDVYESGTDTSYNDIFKRADKKMYMRKEQLKRV